MLNIAKLSADNILSISTKRPELLFSNTFDIAKGEYHFLSKKWHPDYNPDNFDICNKVFTHINVLWTLAQKKFSSNDWGIDAQTMQISLSDGKIYKCKYRHQKPFELGDLYIGDMRTTWLLGADFSDLYKNAKKNLASLKEPPAKMKDECIRSLPVFDKELQVNGYLHYNHGIGIVIPKTPDLLLLRDVLNHFGGKIQAEHAAWIISSMLSLACYLSYAGMTHNAISPDTIFISPHHHSIALLGGWWYSTPVSEKMLAAPDRTISSVPTALLRDKVGNLRTDLELIHATAREILGDISGAKLITSTHAPKPMIEWARNPSSKDAFTDYQSWEKAREASFTRRFVNLELTASDIYKE